MQAGPALLEQRLSALKAASPASDPQQRSLQERQIAALELRIQQEKEVKPTPPNVTFSDTMTLHRGKLKYHCSIWAVGTLIRTSLFICLRNGLSAPAT
jgi:hypothetical protein